MQHLVSWIEIPVGELERAQSFYQKIFEIDMSLLTVGNGLTMALFPTDRGAISGALCEHSDFYFPGNQGPLIYLNANPHIQAVLDRVEKNGGGILIPMRKISDERGSMAVILDSEGNRIALHSDE